MTPRVGLFLPQGHGWHIYKKITTAHCYIQNMKALGLEVSEE